MWKILMDTKQFKNFALFKKLKEIEPNEPQYVIPSGSNCKTVIYFVILYNCYPIILLNLFLKFFKIFMYTMDIGTCSYNLCLFYFKWKKKEKP